MLGEVTHLQTILEDLIHLTAEPTKLPPSSEQVGPCPPPAPERGLQMSPSVLASGGAHTCSRVSKVILDLKGSEFHYTYQTPPASPSSTLSRKSSISR